MKTTMLLSAVSAIAMLGTAGTTMAAGRLSVTVEGVTSEKSITQTYARCKPSTDGKSIDGENLRPAISWSGAPKGTKSLAVFIMDPDVPADFTNAGKEGKVIAASAKRKDFFHYGVVDIPANTTQLNSGHADTPPVGTELVNDMGANKYVTPETQYGGPCPPWNDERMHHYHFIVLALDGEAPVTASARRTLEDSPENPNSAKSTFDRLIMSKHVLAKGTVIGTYTLNPTLKK